jgi:hypothetical protein
MFCMYFAFIRSITPTKRHSCNLVGPDRARLSGLHKRSRSHHGLENYFFGACGRHGCKGLCDARIYQGTFVGV